MAQDVVIAGVGTTDFSKNSKRSEHQLAVEAIVACLDDAGIGASEIDGMVTFTMDETSEVDIRRELRVRVAAPFFTRALRWRRRMRNGQPCGNGH